MGILPAQKPASLARVLFTPVQQRVLGLLFGQPERRFRSSEIIRLASSGTGAVHRQLQRLASAGLVVVTRQGNQKHYQARKDSPIFAELHGLVVKTIGLLEPLREALSPLADRIDAAFVFGTNAAGRDEASSDIDLFLLSDEVEYPDVYESLQAAEVVLARPVHPRIMKLREWQAKKAKHDSFAARLAVQPKLFVLGDEDALL